MQPTSRRASRRRVAKDETPPVATQDQPLTPPAGSAPESANGAGATPRRRRGRASANPEGATPTQPPSDSPDGASQAAAATTPTQADAPARRRGPGRPR